MRWAGWAFVFLAIWALAPTAADANVQVRINKSTQMMDVYVDGQLAHSWPVSTGRGAYNTPGGVFRPQRLERRWYSRKYYNSPMPHAIFFNGGYAIHGTMEVSKLGRRASHGCIRLHPENAAQLFQIVRDNGAGQTRIMVGQ